MLGLLNCLIGVTVLFVAIALFMRWFTGWDKLEAAYRYQPDREQQRISRRPLQWVGARLRFSDVKLAVEIHPDGLWVRIGYPMNLVLKTLFIPWSAVDNAQMKKTVFGRKVILRIAKCPFKVQIYGEVAARIYAICEPTANIVLRAVPSSAVNAGVSVDISHAIQEHLQLSR